MALAALHIFLTLGASVQNFGVPGKQCHHTWVPTSIIHFTYGQDFDTSGHHTYGRVGFWHWDKRDYTQQYPPLPIKRPPAGTGEAVVRLLEEVEQAGFSAAYCEWWAAKSVPRV